MPRNADWSNPVQAEWASRNLVGLQATLRTLNASLKSVSQLGDEGDQRTLTVVEKLKSRYWRGHTAFALEESLGEEWLEDLAEYPIDLIEKAARNWRKSDKGFAPASAGVLMASVKSEFSERFTMRFKSFEALEAGRNYEPLPELTDEERAKRLALIARATNKPRLVAPKAPRRSEAEKRAHAQAQLKMLKTAPRKMTLEDL